MQLVNVFGTSLSTSFYHGVSLMYFYSFRAAFNAPPSTTTQINVAAIFASDTGMILKLGGNNEALSSSVKFFNCSLVSNFANEEERLFIQPWADNHCLHVLSIMNMATHENYRKYIDALNMMRACISRYFKVQEDEAKLSQCITVGNEIIAGVTEIDSK